MFFRSADHLGSGLFDRFKRGIQSGIGLLCLQKFLLTGGKFFDRIFQGFFHKLLAGFRLFCLQTDGEQFSFQPGVEILE